MRLGARSGGRRGSKHGYRSVGALAFGVVLGLAYLAPSPRAFAAEGEESSVQRGRVQGEESNATRLGSMSESTGSGGGAVTVLPRLTTGSGLRGQLLRDAPEDDEPLRTSAEAGGLLGFGGGAAGLVWGGAALLRAGGFGAGEPAGLVIEGVFAVASVGLIIAAPSSALMTGLAREHEGIGLPALRGLGWSSYALAWVSGIVGAVGLRANWFTSFDTTFVVAAAFASLSSFLFGLDGLATLSQQRDADGELVAHTVSWAPGIGAAQGVEGRLWPIVSVNGEF